MDPEIKAMSELSQALKDLEDAARARVLKWACERYGVPAEATKRGRPSLGGGTSVTNQETTPGDTEHETLADLFSAAGPKNGAERALVAAYWLQHVQGKAEITGFEVNRELKHLGHGSKRINNDFSDLMNHKPQFAVQLRKSGKSQQARKKYKITQAGANKVRELLELTE